MFPTSKTHSICFTKHEHMNLSNFLSQFCVVLRVTLIRLDFLKISPERGRFNLHSFMFHEELIQYQYIFLRITEKWDMKPRTPTGGVPGPRTRSPKMSRWGPGPGTPKYSSETEDFQFSIVLIVYSTLNTLHFTCYKTLH